MRRITIFLLVSLLGFKAFAQSTTKNTSSKQFSEPVYFRIGKSHIEPDFGGNQAHLFRFTEELNRILADTNYVVSRIVVSGSASPDGDLNRNITLAGQRAASLRDYLTEYESIGDSDTSRVHPQARPQTGAIAVKTNLLFDLVSAVNLELEIPIGKRWSIAAGAVFPQWNFDNRYCVTMTEVSLEPRLWLGDREHLPSGKPRNSLTGHFIGVYGHWIERYDLQYQHNGAMGSGYGAGITYGYSHRLGRNFNMEYSIGLGAVYLENKSFRANDDYKYLELKKSSEGWKFLPTRAKISLVWLIGNKGVNRK